MIVTDKRVVAAFAAYVLLAAAVIFRVGFINSDVAENADVQKNTRLLTVGSTRGMIYDRNFLPLVNREMHTVLTVTPTDEAMKELERVLTAEDYKKIQSKVSDSRPFVFACDYYNGNCEDIIPQVIYERYSDTDVATHIIGYTDYEGNGVDGTEKAYDSILRNHSGSYSVRYSVDAYGNCLGGIEPEIVDDNYASQGGIVLTIDYDIQRICENAMKINSLERGAVVVLDAETSEILALASTPEYNRDDMSASLTDDDRPFLNRAVSAYPVGSVFKPVVAAAALENSVDTDLYFSCDGFINVSGVKFNCHNRSGHGMVNMSDAMCVSCNAYFISLGIDVGSSAVISLARELGFGKADEICDNMVTASGNLPDENAIDSSAALANLSFGQGELLATPVQIAAVYSAFANSGYYNEPYLCRFILDKNGDIEAYYKNESSRKVLTEGVCNDILEMLELTVEEGSGKLARPMNGKAYGKTATAETGQYEDGEKIVHTWFAGIYEYNNKKYTIVVFRENGNSSSTDCAPVFRDIADMISGKN